MRGLQGPPWPRLEPKEEEALRRGGTAVATPRVTGPSVGWLARSQQQVAAAAPQPVDEPEAEVETFGSCEREPNSVHTLGLSNKTFKCTKGLFFFFPF